METLAELRRKRHFSVSALKTFLSCPRKHHLMYVERARADYFAAALALGSAWHEAVASWLVTPDEDAGRLDTQLADHIRRRLRRQDIPVLFDEDHETEDAFIARAVAMFETFRRCVPRPRRVLASELPFTTSIVHPRTGETLSLPVIGAIDAVVIDHQGQVRLWELKTGKKKWSVDQVDYDVQTTLYRKAARDLGYTTAALQLLVTTKAKEPQMQVVDVERSESDEAELAELFLDVHRAIEAGVSFRQRGYLCSTCQYTSACRP